MPKNRRVGDSGSFSIRAHPARTAGPYEKISVVRGITWKGMLAFARGAGSIPGLGEVHHGRPLPQTLNRLRSRKSLCTATRLATTTPFTLRREIFT